MTTDRFDGGKPVRRLTRRSFVQAAATFASLGLLAACAPGAAPSPAPTAVAPQPTRAPAAAAPTTAPAPQPTRPAAAAAPTAVAQPTKAPAQVAAAPTGQLKLLWWQAPTILNSHLAQGTKDYDASRLALEPLAAYGPDGKPAAVLAAEVPTVQNGGVSQDLRTVTWKLKPGVKWHDGSDFTADDVVFTYRYMADEKTAATTSQAVEGIASVEAKDNHTVVVSYQEPNPNYYQIFVGYLSHIIQKKQFEGFMGEKAKDAPGNLKPVGTGPFIIRDFKPGDVVLYDFNPNYHIQGQPGFKEVQFKGGGDATSAARAVFQTGDVDYAWNLQVEATILNQLIQAGRGELVTAVSPNVERLLLNRADPNTEVNGARSEPSTKHPFLSDLKVRQALAMAVDRKSIAEQLYGAGLSGTVTYNILTAPNEFVSPNTEKLEVSKYDIARANQLLDEAGWRKGADGIREKDGVKMRIVYQTTVNPVRQKTQDIVKSGWEQLGIQVELKAVQAGVFFSSDVGNPDTASKFYADVEMFTNGQESPDPTNYLAGWTTRQIAQKSNEWRGNNYERYSHPQYDEMAEQLRRETDPAKRKDLIIRMNDLLVSDVVIIPLVARKSPVSGRSKHLQGIKPNPWDSEIWNIGEWTKTGG